jgi:hypothetical protein
VSWSDRCAHIASDPGILSLVNSRQQRRRYVPTAATLAVTLAGLPRRALDPPVQRADPVRRNRLRGPQQRRSGALHRAEERQTRRGSGQAVQRLRGRTQERGRSGPALRRQHPRQIRLPGRKEAQAGRRVSHLLPGPCRQADLRRRAGLGARGRRTQTRPPRRPHAGGPASGGADIDGWAQQVDAFFRQTFFEVVPDVHAHIDAQERNYTRLYHGLLEVLANIEMEPLRLHVLATAGNGKTLVARHFFDQCVERGGRPLLLCFNRPLAERLIHLVADGGLVATWYRFCDRFLQSRGIQLDYDAMWGESGILDQCGEASRGTGTRGDAIGRLAPRHPDCRRRPRLRGGLVRGSPMAIATGIPMSMKLNSIANRTAVVTGLDSGTGHSRCESLPPGRPFLSRPRPPHPPASARDSPATNPSRPGRSESRAMPDRPAG